MSLCFLGFNSLSVKAAGEIELKANKKDIRRITTSNRIIEYKIVIAKKGYQFFTVDYLENSENKIGEGYHVVLRNSERKILHETRNLTGKYTSPKFGIKVGEAVFVSITEDLEELDPVNGMDVKFIFKEVADKYYEVEDNSSFEASNRLVNRKNVKGNLHAAADEDFFRYKALETGKTKLTFNTKKNDPDLFDGFKLEIYDNNKNLIFTKSYLRDKFVYSNGLFQKGDEMYVKVLASNQSTAPLSGYKLAVSSEKKAIEEKEENDKQKKANKLTSKIRGILSGEDDKDFFVFTPPKTKTYKVSLETEFLDGKKYNVKIITNKNDKVSLKKTLKKSGSFDVKAKKGERLWISISGSKAKTPVAKEYTLEIK